MFTAVIAEALVAGRQSSVASRAPGVPALDPIIGSLHEVIRVRYVRPRPGFEYRAIGERDYLAPWLLLRSRISSHRRLGLPMDSALHARLTFSMASITW